MEENKKKIGSKKYLLLFLILFIFLAIGYYNLFGKPTKPNSQTIVQAPVQKPVITQANKLEGQESREIILNFGTTYVVFTGYPYVDKAYRPRLYNLIHVNTIFEPDDMVNLTDPSGKWAEIFEISAKESKIYMPIGRTESGAPIWQTMEIISKERAESMIGTCSSTPLSLTGNLKAVSYTCQNTESTKQFAGNVACFIPVENEKGILYRQFSGDGSTKADMCDVLKNNYIYLVKLKAF